MSSNVQNPNPFISEGVFWSEDPEQFRIQFVRYWNDISRGTNQREISIYPLSEALTGQQWADPTNSQNSFDGFRKSFYLPAPLGPIATIAHGYTDAELATFNWTKILGAYTNKAGNPRGASISSEIDVNPLAGGSTITFAVPAAFQVTYTAIVVLEYFKN